MPGPEIRLQAQEKIAQCMESEGFNYVPWIEGDATVFLPVDPNIDFGTREFAVKYGFGVSTQAYAQRDVGPNLVGYIGNRSGVAASVVDPNVALVEAMSEEEANAYRLAYWGADNPLFSNPSDFANDESGEAGSPFDYGCVGEGQGVYPRDAQPFVDRFSEELRALTERIESDSEFVDFATGVERCVRAEGYGFYEFQQMPIYFDQLVMNDIEPLVSPDPFLAASESELQAMTTDERDALANTQRTLSDEAKRSLDELQELETSVAVVEWDCGGGNDDVLALREEISARLQQDFIESLGEELDEFRR